MRLADIWREKITCIIHTSTQEEADMLFKAIDSYDHKGTTWASWWNIYKEKTCYRTNLGEAVTYGCIDNYIKDGEKVIEFSDLVATGGYCNGFRGGNTPRSVKMEAVKDRTKTVKDWIDSLSDAWAKLGCTSFIMSPDEIKKMEEKKMPTKFTFYTEEGYRIDKSNNSKVETITTFVKINGFDNTYLGMATCDKVDYSERDGILNAIANAVLGGNFDREYEKFLADKKRKYDESCKCKICGRNYYEDEKTGKRAPFTPEDARKHEEWHEQNKKNKREKYLIRKEAKRRLAEAEREGKIEQTMKELYKK